MAGKKISRYKFSKEESEKLQQMVSEIKEVCNEYGGPDNELETPYKYSKNHVAYSMKQFSEEIEQYTLFNHYEDFCEKSWSNIPYLKRRLSNLQKWIVPNIQIFRYTKSEQFETTFHDSEKYL